MTGKTVEEAVEAALDRLGVAETDAEVVVVEEPKSGVFGLRRSNARNRARVRPVQPRAKRPSRRGTGASGGGDRGARRQSGRSEGRKAADEAERDGSRASSSGGSRTNGGQRQSRGSDQNGSQKSRGNDAEEVEAARERRRWSPPLGRIAAEIELAWSGRSGKVGGRSRRGCRQSVQRA